MVKNIKNNKLLMQIIKFVIVGGIATIIDFVVLIILKEIFGMKPVFANIISFTVSVIYNYIASIKWVFDVDKDQNKKKQFIIFVVLSIIGLGINTIIIWLCDDVLGIYYLIGKILATGIVMVFNFITRKIFLEKNKSA